MALSFPTNPTIGQEFSGGGKTWAWTGAAWEAVASSSGAGLPEGAKTLITSGYSSSSAYAYTPSASLPAGSYMLTASACQSLYAKVGSSKFKSNDDRLVFRSTSAIPKIEFKADHEIDFSNLDILQAPNPLHFYYNQGTSSNGVVYSKYIGQSRGVHYAYQYPSGMLFKSIDAVNWINTSISASQVSQGVPSNVSINTIGEKTVILQSYRTLETSDMGATWVSFAHNLNLQAVSYGNGMFVGTSGSTAYSSPDGYTWTNRGAVFSNTVNSIIFDGVKFVAAGYGKVYSSADGITWVVRTSSAGSTAQAVYQLAYSGSLYMLIGNTGECWTSADATTWTQKTAFPGTVRGLIYFNGKFAAISQGVTRGFYTSIDGASWTASYIPGNKLVEAMTTINDWGLNEAKSEVFVIASTNGGTHRGAYAKSTNLTDWVQWAGEENFAFSSFRYAKIGSDIYFATSSTMYKTSDAGITWSAWSIGTTNAYNLQAFTYADGKFFGVGQVGGATYSTYWWSTDGVTWTYGTSDLMSGYFSHAYSDGKYLYAITNSTQYVYRISANTANNRGVYLGTTGQQYLIGTANGFTYYHNGSQLYYIDWTGPTPKYQPVYRDYSSTAIPISSSDTRAIYLDGIYLFITIGNGGVVEIYAGETPGILAQKVIKPAAGTAVGSVMRFIGNINGTLYFAGSNNTATYNSGEYYPILKLSNLNESLRTHDGSMVSSALEVTGQKVPFDIFKVFDETISGSTAYATLGLSYNYNASNGLRGVAVMKPKPTYFSLYALEENYYN
jgi:hypothetical protein